MCTPSNSCKIYAPNNASPITLWVSSKWRPSCVTTPATARDQPAVIVGMPNTAWNIQCALNHEFVNTLPHLAIRAPVGRMIKNPTPHRIACAMSIVWYGRRGGSWNTGELLPEFDVGNGGRYSPVGLAVPTVLSVKVRDRSKEMAPEAICCMTVASTAEDDGFVVAIAQTRFCDV
jgi:hypothetical protein